MLDQLMFSLRMISQMEAKAFYNVTENKIMQCGRFCVEENWGHVVCLRIVQPYAIIKTLNRSC